MQTDRSHAGNLIAGTILIVFGLLALARHLLPAFDWGAIWPLAILGLGVLFFVAMFAGGKQAAAFAIPGSITSGVGLVLLFQTLTDHWESMSYFWALILMFVGVGIYIMGAYGGDENQKRSGWRVMKVGLTLFLIFGVFFEMLFSSYNSLVFPLLLIGLGVFLVLTRSGLLGNRHIDGPTDHSIPPAS